MGALLIGRAKLYHRLQASMAKNANVLSEGIALRNAGISVRVPLEQNAIEG